MFLTISLSESQLLNVQVSSSLVAYAPRFYRKMYVWACSIVFMSFKLDWKAVFHFSRKKLTSKVTKAPQVHCKHFLQWKELQMFLTKDLIKLIPPATCYSFIATVKCTHLITFGKSLLLTRSLTRYVPFTSSLHAVWMYGFIATLGFCKFFTFGIIIYF